MSSLEYCDERRAKAICTLLGIADLGHVWSADGPSELANELRRNGEGITIAQRMMLCAAWALWDGSEAILLARLAHENARYADVLTHLIIATTQGASAMEKWIHQYGPQSKSGVHRTSKPAGWAREELAG